MVGFELVKSSETREADPTLAGAIVAEAEKRGLILLVCGTRFNVVRILPPLTIADDLLLEGIDIMEHAISAAIASS